MSTYLDRSFNAITRIKLINCTCGTHLTVDFNRLFRRNETHVALIGNKSGSRKLLSADHHVLIANDWPGEARAMNELRLGIIFTSGDHQLQSNLVYLSYCVVGKNLHNFKNIEHGIMSGTYTWDIQLGCGLRRRSSWPISRLTVQVDKISESWLIAYFNDYCAWGETRAERVQLFRLRTIVIACGSIMFLA